MKHVATLVLLILSAGCGSSAARPPGPAPGQERIGVVSPGGEYLWLELHRDDDVTTGRVDAPVVRVWDEMAAVYAGIGLAPERLTVYDPASRRIGAAGIRIQRLADQRLSLFLDCGSGLGSPKADNGQTRITLDSWLASDGEDTRVMTRLEGTARDVGTSSAPIRCTSNGRLEREILLRLDRRIRGESP